MSHSQGLLAFCLHPGGVKTETALNMPDYMTSYLTQTPELSGNTIVWMTRERREWYVWVDASIETQQGNTGS